MRLPPLFFLLSTLLLASPKEMSSFNSSFEQRIVDEHGKTLLYKGELWATKPQNALWLYQTPIQKSVYINGKELTIIEPALEQVTIKTLTGEIDFLEILKKAKKVDNDHYATTLSGITYSITFKNDILSTIGYSDSYDNRVIIKFLTPITNGSIEAKRFKPIIPSDFDVLRDR
ncbi:MAG: LolA-like outer membrane lipoprotein chaperone [Campylobacterales bacterium]|nr:LolA-like outer membrane lipoprotein chaperone [Campylobacterales bacterium]